MHDIFTFEQTGVNEQAEAEGYFAASGIRPNCLARLARAGVELPLDMFEHGSLEIDRYSPLSMETHRL
jgi:pilus assembly protein CpaF